MTAAAFSILIAQFGPKARERRKKFRQECARGTFVDVAPVAFIGPEVLPAEAFSEEILDRLRAL